MKSIKETPQWKEYQELVESELVKLCDIQKIQGEVDLEARKKAVKIIKDILYIVNNEVVRQSHSKQICLMTTSC